MKKRILAAGNANLDILLKLSERRVCVCAGGSALNFAKFYSNFSDIALFACIGKDYAGNFLLNEIRKRGIVDEIRKFNEKSGKAIILVKDNGESEIRRIKGANRFFNSQEIPDSYDILHLTRICDEMLAKVADRFEFLSLNPGASICKEIFKYAKKIDLLFLNREEASKITKETNVEKIKEVLQNFFSFFVLTLGDQGSVVVREDEELYIPAMQTNVIDVTGAGDAYAAGFLYIFLRKEDIEKAAEFATYLAKLCVETLGTDISVSKDRFRNLKFSLE